MIRRPPRSTLSSSSAASDVYKRQYQRRVRGREAPKMMLAVGRVTAVLGLVALVHTVIKVRQYGLVNAWHKSLARKGSWTASIHHFIAMLRSAILEGSNLPLRLKQLKSRNIWGRFIVNTGERHTAEQKRALRERVEAESALVGQSDRFLFYLPTVSRDRAVHALYNDEQTMLPYLPTLCGMSLDQMTARREQQRRDCLGDSNSKISCFFDVVDTESNALVGTAGFRSLEDGVAEWGVVVARAWQRRGVCSECFHSNAEFAFEHLNCHTIRVATLAVNSPMRAFLAKRGMHQTGSVFDHGQEWLQHDTALPLQHGAALPSTAGH
eukprot:TRINITY_DN10494_c0_g1_i2.p1 TRINITY_DN10494_c0_g1~~TRINITY_DN10494_c0_g1_i2.p1  ORF type:complete len:324 (+),score=67.63 TRINITY_DN10494_c0_g1_i2:100-1071(+)